ncbi:hypothetical protein ACWEOH_02375 [Agromyces sp. NPDC004153]
MTDIYFGATVTTRAGEVGVVAQEWAHDVLTLRVGRGRGSVKVVAFPVLLESGEVRFFTADSLVVSEPDTP